MACVMVAPSSTSCGVIIITTSERDQQIYKNPELRKKIEALKGRWLIGLHHNWHDWKFEYDPLFDFSMAGDGDLIEVNCREFPRISMDACNFVPETFHPKIGEKFWDILYVARAVYFKNIPDFFDIIRQLYDRGHKYRVLFICPVPPYDKKNKKTHLYEIRDLYDNLFSEAEKDIFSLFTIEYRYPFPFDLDTLAYFYRSSKVFVHTAVDERRCRVAAYAWASGLPVIGMECVGGLLPDSMRCPPYFFESKCHSDFPDQIINAISALPTQEWDAASVRETFFESFTSGALDQELSRMADLRGLKYKKGNLSRANLSIRLGRHHSGVGGPNSLKVNLLDFLRWIDVSGGDLQKFLDLQDPEFAMQENVPSTRDANILGDIFSRVKLNKPDS